MPKEFIFEPWNAPMRVQGKAGCIVGIDYPTRVLKGYEINLINTRAMSILQKKYHNIPGRNLCAPNKIQRPIVESQRQQEFEPKEQAFQNFNQNAIWGKLIDEQLQNPIQKKISQINKGSTRINSNLNEMQHLSNVKEDLLFRVPLMTNDSRIENRNQADQEINLGLISTLSPTPALKDQQSRVLYRKRNNSKSFNTVGSWRIPGKFGAQKALSVVNKSNSSQHSSQRMTNSGCMDNFQISANQTRSEMGVPNTARNTHFPVDQDYSILHFRCQGEGPQLACHNMGQGDSRITFMENFPKNSYMKKMQGSKVYMNKDFSFCYEEGQKMQITELINLNEEIIAKTIMNCPGNVREKTLSNDSKKEKPDLKGNNQTKQDYSVRSKRRIRKKKKTKQNGNKLAEKTNTPANRVYISSNSRISNELKSEISGNKGENTNLKDSSKRKTLNKKSVTEENSPDCEISELKTPELKKNTNTNYFKIGTKERGSLMTPLTISTIKHTEKGQNTVICHVEVDADDMEQSVNFEITNFENHRKIMIVSRKKQSVRRSVSPGLGRGKHFRVSRPIKQIYQANSIKSLPLNQGFSKVFQGFQRVVKMDTDQIFECIMSKNKRVIDTNRYNAFKSKKNYLEREDFDLKSLKRKKCELQISKFGKKRGDVDFLEKERKG